ncbi:DUF2938 domain-containing protein [Luteimonas mephitis]|uniref:DUF2938 domain-containing protein n=1 Tax=Luteimonas mephitis TaxID=83615 RepID=UPI0004786DB9|nr:DUF2938 domain-containing protein [Luteimonas mephitis]
MSTSEILVRAAAIGVGGTLVLDLYAWLLQRAWGIPATNWAMVGRWIGHMPGGRLVQPALPKVRPVPGERTIGWTVHYLIGIGYGLLLVAVAGAGWLQVPTPAASVVLALVLLVLPYFVMMPGMGMGIAASRTPKPNVARLKSVAGHTVFGLGMYLAAVLMAAVAR